MNNNFDLDMRLAIIGRELGDFGDAEVVAGPLNSSAPTPPMIANLLLDAEIKTISSFVPAHLFAQFPQKYINNTVQENYITDHFFDDIWKQDWDLFYLPLPGRKPHDSLIFVPESQAEHMLSHINKVVSENLTLGGMKQDRLVLCFDGLPIPKPLYLGKSHDEQQKIDLEANIAKMENFESWEDLTKNYKSLIFEAFKHYLQNVMVPTMPPPSPIKKSKPKKNKRLRLRAKMKAQWTSQLNWLPSWLGLRQAFSVPEYEDQQHYLSPVNVLMAPAWNFHDQPIFFSIDCEWIERATWTLTEVGISILDTYDLVNLPPGDYGESWKKTIRSYHLRVSEHESHVNKEFCLGCPDKFEWGQSHMIESDRMGMAIDQCLVSRGEGRNMILVGLSMDHDLQLLRRTGSKYFAESDKDPFHDRLDIANLFRVVRNSDSNENLGLSRLLGELNELHSEWLHNAGNDARYTMHALVRIAMEAVGEKQESPMEVVD
ncbi:hypothetical protein N7493_004792 [Penicillium malachiteum]|uniref:Gfd2/YDR514C-like C-terminal domain-containing protein n=1 Tax=Penicillium malachiteum TaxID=1324776 RepID=A0AAD6HP87_9EURO|nr:hypothetical protein N7493_004792 [Penicillium malachiteum]